MSSASSDLTTPFSQGDFSSLHPYIRQRLPTLLQDACDPEGSEETDTAPVMTLPHAERMMQQKIEHIFQRDDLFPLPTPSPSLSLAPLIDHTLLRANATADEVRTLYEQAVQMGFAAVCVNGCRVKECVEERKKHQQQQPSSTLPLVATVIGFPLGAAPTPAKLAETKAVLDMGADEIDMVINIGWIRDAASDSKVWRAIRREIQSIARLVHSHHEGQTRRLKVILETCLLSTEQLIDATLICVLAGADHAKTSTGFSTGGAVDWQVKLMKLIVGHATEVKASGGIRDEAAARRMVAAGATRIGCSAGMTICAAQQPTGDKATASTTSASSAPGSQY